MFLETAIFVGQETLIHDPSIYSRGIVWFL